MFWFNRGTWKSVSYWKIADAISPADSLNNKNILSEEENKRVDDFFNNHNKTWFSGYSKLDEEPKKFIYRNKRHYI